jgi:hypothetical protein
MRVLIGVVVAAVLLGTAGAAQTSGALLAGGSGASGVLTSTVLYAAHTHVEAGTDTLDLLVLLRGEPGWYAHTPRGGSVLTGATSNTTDGHTVAGYWMNGGGLTVTLGTDSALPTVHLSIASGNAVLVDQQVAPERENVVLVDGVGGDAATPRISTVRVDPRLPGAGSVGARAVRRMRTLVDFVQCGTTLPDSIPDEQGPLGRSLRNAITRSCTEIAGAR